MNKFALGVFIALIVIFVCFPLLQSWQSELYEKECRASGGDRVTVRTLPGGQIRSCWDQKTGRRIFLDSE